MQHARSTATCHTSDSLSTTVGFRKSLFAFAWTLPFGLLNPKKCLDLPPLRFHFG
jgi:hypothetical protein